MRNLLSLVICILLGCFCLEGIAHADEKNDLVTWYSNNFDFKVVKNLNIIAQAEYRTKNMTSETDLWMIRTGVRYKFCDWFKASSYCELNNNKFAFLTEGVFTYKPGRFAFDLRERFTLDAASWNIRSKLTCTYKCRNGIVEPYTAVEIFTKPYISQTRVYGGLGFNATEWLKIKSFYCWRYNKAQLRNDHVLGLEFGVKVF